MADLVPFVNNDDDADLSRAHFPDAAIIRVPIHRADAVRGRLPATPLWIDPCVDAFPGCDTDSKLWDYLKNISGVSRFLKDSIARTPDDAAVAAVATDLLERCAALKPRWISVPQLAQGAGTERNRLNKKLAIVTRKWKHSSTFKGKLILPLIFTHQNQTSGKTAWKPRLASALINRSEAEADGVWVVDSSLSDQKGVSNFETSRFPNLISLHDELARQVDGPRIAGPYWGMNLVLWARGLVTNPAIGVGGGFQYYLPGGQPRKSKPRIALPPLRRQARMDTKLRQWLSSSVESMASDDPARRDLAAIVSNWSILTINPRPQIARVYGEWFSVIAAAPEQGRGLALYQDLSNAFVLGKSLKEISSEDGKARRPEIPARQLMLSCL